MKRLAALFCLAAMPCWADMTELPKWHMVSGQACYDFDEAKLLVQGDMRLVACDITSHAFDEMRKQFDLMLEGIKQKDLVITFTQSKADDLKNQLDACITERAAAEVKANSGPSVAWLIAGGLALTLGGFLLGNQLLKK